MVTAALGGEFEVPTIDGGKTRVKVPEGTQSGRRFRLQGKGMPVLRSKQTGDMYVQVVVETPQKLTQEAARTAGGIRKSFRRRRPSRNRRVSSRRSRTSSTGLGSRAGSCLTPAPAARYRISQPRPSCFLTPDDATSYRPFPALRREAASPRRRGAVHPLLAGKAAGDRRGHAVGPALARTMARYVDPSISGPVDRAWPRHRAGDRSAGRRRGSSRRGCVLVEFNPTFCQLLRARFPRRRWSRATPMACADCWANLMRHAGGGGGVGPAAVHQAAQDAAAASARCLRADAAGRAVRAVHLRGGAADPEDARAACTAEASERIWMNLPPARVWVYRNGLIVPVSLRRRPQTIQEPRACDA